MFQDQHRLRKIRDSVALVGRLSDSIVRLGPLSLGIDGVLSWLPGVGDVYSTVAGAFIVAQGVRAGVPAPTLLAAAALLGVRTIAGSVPLAGAAFADLFTAHRWAAAMIVHAIDRKLGVATDASPAWGASRAPAW
jgi:hypothetical protein